MVRDPTADQRQTAVAIEERAGGDQRPIVVAKGYGSVADQIVELAFASGVKVREDADLIEILNAVEVDSEIPVFALATVAEILTYVYRANGQQPSPSHVAATLETERSGE